MKIVIEVSGGVVQTVYSSNRKTKVEIVDWDNIHAAEKVSRREAKQLLAEAIKHAPHVVG